MSLTYERAVCGTSGPRKGYVGVHEPGTYPRLCVECANYVHEPDKVEVVELAQLVERTITELHGDFAAEAPWAPIAVSMIGRMRAEIARMITRERTAAQVCAHPVGDRQKIADRAETQWRATNVGLAAFYDLTSPTKPGQVRS